MWYLLLKKQEPGNKIIRLLTVAQETTSPSVRGFTSKRLLSSIIECDNPKSLINGIPAQALYHAIKQQGISSQVEIIRLIPPEKLSKLLDFDLWIGDRFNEDNIWEWLNLTNDEDGLALLQNILKTIDLKLVSILLGKYVHTIVYSEGSDTPPDSGYYTPDKGFTWVHVITEDPHKYFLLTRFLALIFETSADLFYQLLGVMSVTTETLLEEEAYKDKTRRLSEEGIPSQETAAEINHPLPPFELSTLMATLDRRDPIIDRQYTQTVEPIIYDSLPIRPFSSMITQVSNRDLLESELTFILNNALVFFGTPFFETEAVKDTISSVYGAINIGLEKVLNINSVSFDDVFNKLGLKTLYQLGLFFLYDIHKMASQVSLELILEVRGDLPLHGVVSAAKKWPPQIPLFLNADGTVNKDHTVLTAGEKAIETLDEVNIIKILVKKASELSFN